MNEMKTIEELQKIANRIRAVALTMAHNVNESHSAGALSMADILAVLFTEYIDTSLIKIKSPLRDRFILSKGHCCATYYAMLAEVGILDKDDLMQNFAKNGSCYFAHTAHQLPGVELSTGSLGHGLPVACGMALGAKKSGLNFKVYCLVGDGEMNEGSNWEAIAFAAHHHIDNLCLIIDKNQMQAMGDTKDILSLDPLPEKLEAFNWEVADIDGNNIKDVITAFEQFKHNSGKPFVVVANTIKGKGVSFMEHNLRYHYSAPTEEELKQALEELA